MIERDPQLAAAEQAIADARGGNGSVVFFAGSAGAGKTHLLDAIHSAARGTVLRARGHVSETTLAYGLVRQLFDDLLDELSPPEHERLFGGPAGAALPLLGRGGPPGGGVVDPDLAARHGVWKLLQALACPWSLRRGKGPWLMVRLRGSGALR
ncbi:MAG: AAA family ATPase [Thermoleophilaceae bacterium]